MNASPLVSIIIPIYNRENTLNRCVNSVLSQDFPNFECILVDDGSTDSSPMICDDYTRQDCRIRTIHKENGGVGSARNAGIETAKGEWLFFLDSDDYITFNHLSSLIKLTINTPDIDIVLCSYSNVYSNHSVPYTYNNVICTTKRQIKDFICSAEIQIDTPWMNRMYRRKIAIDNYLRYDTSLPFAEDRLFFYEYIPFIKGIASISNISYIIDRTDETSLSYKRHPEYIYIRGYKKTFDVMKKIFIQYDITPDESLYFWRYHWATFVFIIDCMYDVKKNMFAAIKKQRSFFRDNFDTNFYHSISISKDIENYMRKGAFKDILHQRFFFFDIKKFLRFYCFKLRNKVSKLFTRERN